MEIRNKAGKMEEVADICKDLNYPEKEFIIRKYLFKYLYGESFTKLDVKLITDIFNILDEEEVLEFQEQIEEIIGEFNIEDFVNVKWKIAYCHNCGTLDSVERCKKEHIEECAYSEITEEEGCRNLFCDDCIYHRCENQNPDCPAVRCEACSNV